MTNANIANVFKEIADILEIKGESFFRVNAYRKGALTIENLALDLEKLVNEDQDQISKIAGIGKALNDKIIELVKTGKCQAHEKLKADFPKGLLQILRLRSVGPKKVKLFYESLNITSIEELEKAAQEGKLRDLPKMGEKSEEDILLAIQESRTFSKNRFLIDKATKTANLYINYLKKFKGIEKITYAGSLRRRQETIGDIDILIILKDYQKTAELMKYFVSFEEVSNVLAEGKTKSSVILSNGMQIDLRVVKAESFGAALHYFTGSKEHNVMIRDIAKQRGLKVNEYGLFDGEKMLAGKTEEEIYKKLGYQFIPPEMRLGKKEFEQAKSSQKMPVLIEKADLKYDFQVHSDIGKGTMSLDEISKLAKMAGYSYVVADSFVNSASFTEKLKKQINSLKKYKNLVQGLEVQADKQGNLMIPEDLIKEIDVLMVSPENLSRLDKESQTKRLIAIIENKHVKILNHPTGRLIQRREEMEYDHQKVFKACALNNVAIQVNGQPRRLDLPDKYIEFAKNLGVKFALSSEAKTAEELAYIDFALGISRRGQLTKKDALVL
jgi:DNA polymerase (family 10)